jgi:hypothetical protein
MSVQSRPARVPRRDGRQTTAHPTPNLVEVRPRSSRGRDDLLYHACRWDEPARSGQHGLDGLYRDDEPHAVADGGSPSARSRSRRWGSPGKSTIWRIRSGVPADYPLTRCSGDFESGLAYWRSFPTLGPISLRPDAQGRQRDQAHRGGRQRGRGDSVCRDQNADNTPSAFRLIRVKPRGLRFRGAAKSDGCAAA